jgi:hypothetical protein
MLAPAHRPKWISWRSAEIRIASMKPKLKLDLSSPHPDLCRCSSKKLETSAGPDDGITAKRDRAKILGGMLHSYCRLSGRDT